MSKPGVVFPVLDGCKYREDLAVRMYRTSDGRIIVETEPTTRLTEGQTVTVNEFTYTVPAGRR